MGESDEGDCGDGRIGGGEGEGLCGVCGFEKIEGGRGDEDCRRGYVGVRGYWGGDDRGDGGYGVGDEEGG